jgi:hypothetical protein
MSECLVLYANLYKYIQEEEEEESIRKKPLFENLGFCIISPYNFI